jgi:hypothetical protein
MVVCATRGWTLFEMCAHECITTSHICEHGNRGLGLSPNPTPTPKYTNSNLNKFKLIYITSNKIWRIGRADFSNSFHVHGGHGVEFGGLHKILNNNHYQTNEVPCGSPSWATWHQTIGQKDATCLIVIHPTANSALTCHQLPP